MGSYDAALDRSLAEAKAGLREWGVYADEDLGEQVAAVRRTVGRIAPWAVGAGVLMSLFTGRKGRKARAAEAAGGSKGFGIGKMIGIALELMPLILSLMPKGKRRG